MDYALLNLAVTFALFAATFLARKRILRAMGRLLIKGLLDALGAPPERLWVEEVSKASDGTETRVRALSGPWRAYLGAIATAMFQEVVKSFKLKPSGGGMPNLEGVDLSNLATALPAILPMLPKKYQGLVAIAAPFLQGFLGNMGGLGGAKPGQKPKAPVVEEVIRR